MKKNQVYCFCWKTRHIVKRYGSKKKNNNNLEIIYLYSYNNTENESMNQY